jgi:8-oxo-dGTP diphosphatase
MDLLDNGLVIEQTECGYLRGYRIRRFDPRETIDSKWDVYNRERGTFDAAACLCFGSDDYVFTDYNEAIELANRLQPVKDYAYEFPMPAITVDAVIFREAQFRELEVLLIRRKNAPFQGHLALPGGYMEINEDSLSAVKREVQEEVSLTIPHFSLVGVFDDPQRDVRGRVVSIVYKTLVSSNTEANAGDDAAEVQWVSVENALNQRLAFDHNLILSSAKSQESSRWV